MRGHDEVGGIEVRQVESQVASNDYICMIAKLPTCHAAEIAWKGEDLYLEKFMKLVKLGEIGFSEG